MREEFLTQAHIAYMEGRDMETSFLDKKSDGVSSFLRISMIQSDIIWENIEENICVYGKLLSCLAGKTDIAVLPEMCTTGFSFKTKDLAEANDGKTITGMKKYARDYNIAITGSFMASDNGNYYNRAFFLTPDGREYYYDKRHLFRMAGEDKYFSSGTKRLIVDYLGWKICLMVCYDIRFPVWCRNTDNEYDLLIYVANWPEARIDAWKTLLKARAIENMCYVCGVNRVGVDVNDVKHNGCSRIYSPKGEKVFETENNKISIITGVLEREKLDSLRVKFPAWKDADKFEIDY